MLGSDLDFGEKRSTQSTGLRPVVGWFGGFSLSWFLWILVVLFMPHANLIGDCKLYAGSKATNIGFLNP